MDVFAKLVGQGRISYVDLGTADYHFSGTTFVGTPHTTDSMLGDLKFNVVRAGLNYRF
jgi:opacity protein-like surface antigen